jgi:hypothetical protein
LSEAARLMNSQRKNRSGPSKPRVCPHCKGNYRTTRDMWRHLSRCPKRPKDIKTRREVEGKFLAENGMLSHWCRRWTDHYRTEPLKAGRKSKKRRAARVPRGEQKGKEM